ncbi:MAG: hydrogenase [Rhodoferax sp.]|nr:hydrogenase [Rhodoferax sp.]
MTAIEIEAPALLKQLVENYQAPWIDFDNLDPWLGSQQGDQVLLFAGDPVRFPEGMDVAVVLPELHKASASAGKPFGIAVAVPDTAEDLAKKFGSNRWPTLMFFRSGQYVTTVCGMHDWTDYLSLISQALDAPVSRAPTIGIPVVSSSPASSHCH